MKKTLTILSLIGATAMTTAQVGINNDTPDSTLDVVAGSDNNTSDVEGLLIPRVSKQKALNMAASAPEESTLIYVNDITTGYTPPTDGSTDTEVEEITANGFYHWNGAKWIAHDGGAAEPNEWVYESSENDVTLVRSYDGANFPNKVFFDENGGFKSLEFGMIKDPTTNIVDRSTENLEFNYFYPYNAITKNISSLNLERNTDQHKYLNYEFLNLDESAGETAQYFVHGNSMGSLSTNTNLGDMARFVNYNASIHHQAPSNIASAVNFRASLNIGELSSATNTYNNELGLTNASTQEVTNLYNQKTTSYLKANSNTTNVGSYYAITRLYSDATLGSYKGLRTNFIMEDASTATSAYGYQNIFNLAAGSNVTDLFGIHLSHSGIAAGANIDNFYGIYIQDVNQASTNNYSLYTNDGDIRFGDLAGTGERIVTADANGVLSTGVLSDYESLWGKRDVNGIEETYLIPALNNTDIVSYRGDKSFYINIGEVTKEDNSWLSPVNGVQRYGYDPNQPVPLSFAVSSKALANTSILGEAEASSHPLYALQDNISLIEQDHALNASSGKSKAYIGISNRTLAKDVTTPIEYISGHETTVDYYSNAPIKTVVGGLSKSGIGSDDGQYSPTVENSTGFRAQTLNYATSNNITALVAVNNNRGEATNIKGAIINNRSRLADKSGNIIAHTLNDLIGVEVLNKATMNGSIQDMRGLNIESTIDEGTNLDGLRGVYNNTKFNSNSTTNYFVGNDIVMRGMDNANVDALYGIRVSPIVEPNFNVISMYGMRINDVSKGSDRNYAIHTGLGEVSFGDNVVVRGSGTVTANSFIASNGDTFPDYVFQNYYNGASNLNADYEFKTLNEVEAYIKENGHLPGYVSAKEVAEAGQFDMTATQLTNVEKIEELYLHSIEQEKKLQEKEKEVKALKAELKAQKAELKAQKAENEAQNARLEKLEQLLMK